MPLRDRLPILRRRTETAQRSRWPSLTIDDWVSFFQFNGLDYPFGVRTTSPGQREQQIAPDFSALSQLAYKQNGIVFACITLRMMVFSEARFQWQDMSQGRPGKLFGNPALSLLEAPWPNGTTGDLLARAELDVSLGGNFFAVKRPGPSIRRLRPDWVMIILGSFSDPEQAPFDPDAEPVGYLYYPGGVGSGADPWLFDVSEVAHYMPHPDPEATYLGMSWLNPVITEVMGDKAFTRHKLRFVEGGATPNLVVNLQIKDQETFDSWVAKFKQDHEGVENAYKTLFLSQGVDVKVVGSSFQQMDFKVTQGAGETRVAAAARTPPVLVGLSEGLAASTYNNYGQARRSFADGTMRPLWRNFAGSMEKLLVKPSGAPSRLWYDTRDIPFLQEDRIDSAQEMQYQAAAIRLLVDAGFDPETVVEAVETGDLTLLEHGGLPSVQLQPEAAMPPKQPPNQNGKQPAAAPAARQIAALTAGEQGEEDQ